MDLRRLLYENIVLSGGSTLFKGEIEVSPICLRTTIGVDWIISSRFPLFLQVLVLGFYWR